MFVYLQVTDKEWRPGKIMIPSDFPELEEFMGDFAEYMAEVYKEDLQRAIDDQRYEYKWEDLTIPYYEYKEKNNLSLNKWEATGFLKSNIDYWWTRDAWVVGIDKYSFYQGTFVSAYDVARFMEYGTEKMPARPLFRPLARYLSKHVRRYWHKFLDSEGINYEDWYEPHETHEEDVEEDVAEEEMEG